MDPDLFVDDLVALLDLEVLDTNLFRGRHGPDAKIRTSLYGGQVAAQALRAATATVPPERAVHSLHGYFLRPGLVDRPVIFEVDRDRDGGSFSARHVRAVQGGEVIFSMLASFHVPADGPTFDEVPRGGRPDPEGLASRPAAMFVDAREVTRTRIDGDRVVFSDCLWVRAVKPLPDDPVIHACVLTYVSDFGSGFGQVDAPGLAPGGPSIDHSLWFHEPIRADDWMLLELQPSKAHSERGVYRGSISTRDGTLGLVLTQEILLRERPLSEDERRRLTELTD
ncbi:MAG TPA: acyl-CoA thioesterase domain-containing protein [Acidimicrobiia bacterium]|nr:acyl-CoA thioesterase domain-containing protein [Acidimicrobiia bacterium]